MSEQITIRFTDRVVGYPDPPATVTVERTDRVTALIELGKAVEVDDPDDDPGPDRKPRRSRAKTKNDDDSGDGQDDA